MNITECKEVEWAEPSLGVGAMTCLCEHCHESLVSQGYGTSWTLGKLHVQNVWPSVRLPSLNKC